MPQTLKVLLVEDNPVDAELVLLELQRAGFEPQCQRVDTEAAFLERLDGGLDLVLSDYAMPKFNGFRALELLKQSGLKVPFILVSGTIGEDLAVVAMKNGAADYVMKDRLARLGAAVTHAIAESRLRRERRETNAALRVAHAQMSRLLEHSPAVLYALKLDGDKLVPHLVSENISTLLGFTVAEAAGPGWWLGQLHPDDREQAQRSLGEAITAGASHAEYRMRHKDGHYRWVDDTRRVIRAANGAAIEFTGVWSDVTESKRAEDIVRQASGHLVRNQKKRVRVELAVLFAATAAIYLLAGRFQWFEAGTRWISAHEADKLDDLMLTTVFFSAVLAVFAFRRWREAQTELTSRQHVQTALKLLHDELDWRVKQRTEELGKANLALRAEVAERRRAEEELRASEGRYRTLFEQAPDGIVIADAQSRYLDANASICRMLGYTRAELIGLRAVDILAPAETSQIEPTLNAVEGKANHHREWQFRRKDGTFFPAEVLATTMPGGNLLAMIRDLTERKNLEAQFLRAQRVESIGTLASGVAHDLNNILAPVLMAAGLLKSKLTEKRDRDILTLVEHSAQRGASIIGQLLTFSRGIEGARMIVQPRHLLKEMVNIMRETFPRNIEISQDVPNDLWCVLADSTQLHQVLLNLCVNARDAMPNGGKLSLGAANLQLSESEAKLCSLAKPGPYLVLSVTDTGHGIPTEILARIFDPFFTTKGVGKGTGLGLSTVFGIAKSHEGAVTVSSEPGRGSVFKVYLPATRDATNAKEAESTVPMPRGHRELILVVDDEAAIRETTGRVLREHDYRVLEAKNGEEAIRLFVENLGSVCLVLTDLMMPGMGAVELVRSLRVLDPGIRIIATSGMDRDDKSAELAGMNISQMLPKPCVPAVILQAIEQALAGNAPDSKGRREMAGAFPAARAW